MKKLILMMGIIYVSFNVHAQTTPLYTLNDYTYDDALKLREDFRKSNTKLPKQTSVWFSKAVIKNILNMLKTEKAPNGNSPDGIRIYFGYIENKITILLVSTYAFGMDPTVHSKTFHQDYFEHSDTITLFSTPGVKGAICTDKLCGGALLYKDCGTPCLDDQTCITDGIHYITRSYGQGLVGHFGDTPITTKSEWFDLDMFNAVDQENTYDGIRIYLGKHPKDDPNVKVRNLEAFVIVTTNGPTPDKQTDNFNCKKAQQSVKILKFIKTQKKHFKNVRRGFVYYTPFFNGQDNGEICPTHCQGTTLQ